MYKRCYQVDRKRMAMKRFEDLGMWPEGEAM